MSYLLDFQSSHSNGLSPNGVKAPYQRDAAAPFVPKLTVIGIGAPEFITQKALNALRNADVVLYDTLGYAPLLDYAPAVAPHVFVGAKAYTQQEINERIVAYAKCCGHVVRLKSGAPYDRVAEELQFAHSFNIATSFIPAGGEYLQVDN